MRALAAAALTLLLAPLVGGGALAAETYPVDPSCGTPLGVEQITGANNAVRAGPGPEFAAVDAVRMPGGQRSPEVMISAWGTIVLVAEVKVDQASNFTWAIMARLHSNTSGWNTTPIWLSSPDTSQYYPQGAHIRPSAVLWNDRVWVAWDGQGSTLGGPNDRFVLMRSFNRTLVADTTRIASASDPNRTTQHPVIAVDGGALTLAYSSSDGDSAPNDAHIVVRSFDGAAFGAERAISNLSDGWGDQLPALASGSGSALFAAWNSVNATGETSYLMFAWRNGSTWSVPAQLAPLGNTGASGPALAFFAGRAFVAYSTAYLVDLSGTDSEVRWFTFDPVGASFSGPVVVNPEPTGGDDAVPTLTVLSSGLYVGWSTTEDLVYSHSSDTDPVYRIFDGQGFGPVVELSYDGDNDSDAAPSFLEVGRHVYAHWMLTPPQMPGDPRGNSREVIRLVSRPTQWYDNLSVMYRISAVSDNGSVNIRLSPEGAIAGHPLVVRLPGGTLFPVGEDAQGPNVWAPVDAQAPDFELLACGVPVSTYQPDPVPPLPVPNYGPAILAFGVGLALLYFFVRSRKRKDPSDPE